MAPLGMRIVFLTTAEESGGQLLEYEVFGRPKGFPAQTHLHPLQSERHEVVSGALTVRMKRRDRVLGPGERGGEYVFVDEWDVAAPPDAVFYLLADARTYPSWWRPVYIDVESDGPPEPGRESRQHFKGRLPYHLRTRSTITVFEPPRQVGADVVGDLRGQGLWTLTPTDGGTHVRFDWKVFADKPILRTLTPAFRPLFRWNHNWAIARAREGLEPAAQRRAEQGE